MIKQALNVYFEIRRQVIFCNEELASVLWCLYEAKKQVLILGNLYKSPSLNKLDTQKLEFERLRDIRQIIETLILLSERPVALQVNMMT